MARDLIAVGRISVDLYAHELYASFAEPQTFTKAIGGSPTNVAVAAARLGHSAAIVTKVGDDQLGPYVLAKLASFGVDTAFVTSAEGLTPIVLASLDPPESPAIQFYRAAVAPDTLLNVGDLPEQEIRDCGVLWMSACALAQGVTAQTCLTWLGQRDRMEHTILDLDYRPSFWASPELARAAAQEAIPRSTIVLGNRAECEMALGVNDPDAAVDELLARGVTTAIVKMGADGVLLASAHDRVAVEPLVIDVACGLGAGDAFGGALVHGLLAGWPLDMIGRFANAAGALVASRPMCSDGMPTVDELDMFMEDTEEGTLS